MKIFKLFIVTIFSAVGFLSCQKELKFDENGVSTGSLKKDGSGNCTPVTANGIFKVDSLLNASHFADVQVNVSVPGTFEIKSDTVNGYSFRKVGSMAFGLNTIRLYASGKPIAAGTNTFTIKYGSSTCTFSITVIPSTASGAVYTIGGAPGACTGAIAGGTYVAGVALAPSNTLTIQVDVTAAGYYTIGAATTNGFVFSGSGVFTTTGLQNVVLTGTGTPLNAGATVVTVTNLSTTCSYGITVQPSGGGTPAVFTLDGAPGGCTAFALSGTYAAGVAASASNTVKLNVTVTTAGTYSITTNTANGITFNGSGTLAAGAQQITLTASGIPAAAGTFTFNPNITNSCNFSVTCTTAPPIPAGDYFPLTQNSNWSYSITLFGVLQTDTAFYKATAFKTYNGNQYREFEVEEASVPTDTLHYRKSGNDYFHWAPNDYYSGIFQFDNPVFTDINFLKENAATGTTWASAELNGTSGGAAAKLRYDFKIESANTSLTVNGVTFTNVIHVSCTAQVSILGAPFTPLDISNFYYAKGGGLIKAKNADASAGTPILELDLKHYTVF